MVIFNVFVAAAVILTSVILSVFLNMHGRSSVADENLNMARTASWLMLLNSVLIGADLAAGGDMAERLQLDMAVIIVPVFILTFSLWRGEERLRLALYSAALELVLIAVYLMMALDVLMIPSSGLFSYLSLAVVAAYGMMFMAAIWIRASEVRTMVRSGSVWNYLLLLVDSFNLAAYFLTVIAGYMLYSIFSTGWFLSLAALMMLVQMSVMAVRMLSDSAFVFRRRLERRIVESMKIAYVALPTDGTRKDYIYHDIYDRLLDYFEKNMPYLDSSLSINDLTKEVYSNKQYISRAIGRFTGRNFRQFVNYYRVQHSVSLFSANPELKVSELAERSGFNSVVSYNTAFKLFMNENPSDWCRKERYNIRNRKK